MPIFSSTARKANEYARLTVPCWSYEPSRRSRLVKTAEKGEEEWRSRATEKREQDEADEERGREKKTVIEGPLYDPRHYVTRLES